jgi:2-oxoglutarate ferredoxin oxidoreductase subunit alpha
VPGAAVIYDVDFKIDAAALEKDQILPVPVPIDQITKATGGSKIMANTAMLGAMAGLTHFPLEYIESVIIDNFKKKGETLVQLNKKVTEAAYQYVVTQFDEKYSWKLKPTGKTKLMVMSGNEAISLGALASGCNFTSAYPMTPGTSVFQWLTTHADKYGIVSKQTEDEIAALNMAIGAAHAGARAIVPTSGGGFSLMVEALGMAAMTETPVVIVDAQRPGPATGLATRTEQPDLLFVIYASQGEFARIVLAPGNVTQCFAAGTRAFNLAEKYQTPVFILTDAYLANSIITLEKDEIDFKSVQIDRGKLLSDTELDNLQEPYKRYALTDDGISPRALPGHPNAIFNASTNEHTELGIITEDAELRTRMQLKRMRKLELAENDMNAPQYYGPEKANVTFVCWGSTLQPALEAMNQLNQKQPNQVNILHFVDIWPFTVQKVQPLLEKATELIAVEGNSTGQLADLIRMKTGILIQRRILKFDGRPFSPEFIIRNYEKI